MSQRESSPDVYVLKVQERWVYELLKIINDALEAQDAAKKTTRAVSHPPPDAVPDSVS